MKGAFGDGLPIRDLILSPGHAVFVDGVLVPVGPLVNGATIVQEEVESVRYFHVELDAHDVILAEGLPCESYLDDANRETFANSPQHTALHGRLDPGELGEGLRAGGAERRGADGDPGASAHPCGRRWAGSRAPSMA